MAWAKIKVLYTTDRSTMVGGAGQLERDPYWSRPWPSAIALARRILQQPTLVAGRHLCEIGAGTC